ncbi:hypothetical protein L1887_55609 [Cichorium endivia]|nr:hypothetical protein L1887_55609 [Cichorium endivia]
MADLATVRIVRWLLLSDDAGQGGAPDLSLAVVGRVTLERCADRLDAASARSGAGVLVRSMSEHKPTASTSTTLTRSLSMCTTPQWLVRRLPSFRRQRRQQKVCWQRCRPKRRRRKLPGKGNAKRSRSHARGTKSPTLQPRTRERMSGAARRGRRSRASLRGLPRGRGVTRPASCVPGGPS